MGKRSRGVHNAVELSCKAGGSMDTQKHRRQHWAEFSRFAKRLGHILGAVGEAEDWMIEYFIWFMVAGATKAGTLANYRASLSTIHAAAGQDMTASTRSQPLQLEKRDRRGKHRAQTQEEFVKLVAEAQKIDEGVALIIQLMRFLGLRMQEALRCGESLQGWRDLILQGNRRLPVQSGAKNNRPRRTEVLEDHVDETLAVIQAALEFCRNRNFELITGCRVDLESAKSRLRTLFTRLSMRAELASHSLRYMFAVEYANKELDKGTPPLNVLVALSDRLGHGPSRAKMILDVYCWQIRHRFPEKIKLPSDFVPRERTKAEERAASPMHRPSGPFKSSPKRARRRGPARTR
jgi:hypothetical protein